MTTQFCSIQIARHYGKVVSDRGGDVRTGFEVRKFSM